MLIEIIRVIDINLNECFPNLTRDKFEDTFNGVMLKSGDEKNKQNSNKLEVNA